LTGVTAPCVLQSNEAGAGAYSVFNWVDSTARLDLGALGTYGIKQPLSAPNSAVFKSANSLSPTDEVWVLSAFQFITKW